MLHNPLNTTTTNLQVRAQNLQELVYKQGSAGITKATVSIVFHNDDPANGPSGYEDKEYITVTRQVLCRVATDPPLQCSRHEQHSIEAAAAAAAAHWVVNSFPVEGPWLKQLHAQQDPAGTCSWPVVGVVDDVTLHILHMLLAVVQIVIGGRDKYTINGHAAQQG